jgi:hypothetical protein
VKHLKFGPGTPYTHEQTTYIAVADVYLKKRRGGDLLISRECSSLAEIEAEVAEIRKDLSDIIAKARMNYGH